VVPSFLFELQLLATWYYEISLKAFVLLTFRSFIQPVSIENVTLASLYQQLHLTLSFHITCKSILPKRKIKKDKKKSQTPEDGHSNARNM